MQRKAKVFIYSSQVITIYTDLSDNNVNYKFDLNSRFKKGNKDIAYRLWDYMFGIYIVDKKNRLVYLYEPLGNSYETLEKDILKISSNPHPSVFEIFDFVEIIDEESKVILKTIKNVNLIEILSEVKNFLIRHR